MDKAALESHLITLMRIVSGLFAMVGFDGKTLPARGERSFPRPLHRAVTALLRPAESATRRLIICMAAGIKANLPKPRPEGQPIAFFQRQQAARNGHVPSATYTAPSKPRLPSFPLCDPKMRGRPRKRRRRPGEQVPAIPRIRSFEFDPRVLTFAPAPPPPPPPAKLTPDPDRPIDAAKLLKRLAVLGHALETMPKQARRFARWRARRDLELQERKVELEKRDVDFDRDVFFDSKRKSPLPLRATPPGGRRRDYKPGAKHRNMREIDEVLYELNDIAWHAAWPAAWADAWPDTS